MMDPADINWMDRSHQSQALNIMRQIGTLSSGDDLEDKSDEQVKEIEDQIGKLKS